MADTTSISKIKIGQQEYLIKDNEARVALGVHTADTTNPHGVTAAQVGLGNVENKSSATIRSEITSANVTNALGYTPINPNEKGVANGVASLDGTGKVPSSQLPAFVDDVVEAEDYAHLPAEGESGKIYVTLDDNKTYRWGGTTYVEISESLALGNTSSTAFRGDYGQITYDHATDSSRVQSATQEGLFKVGSTAEGHISSLTPVEKSDIVALGIPAQDTTYSSGTGISISGTTINHSNSVTAGNDSPSIDQNDQLVIGNVSYDAQGHVTSKGNTTVSGSVSMTPSGSVSSPTITVTESKSQFLSGVATPGTTPSWSASVDTTTETLSFSWSAGAMPTFNSGNAMTGAAAALDSDPVFTGSAGHASVAFAEVTP